MQETCLVYLERPLLQTRSSFERAVIRVRAAVATVAALGCAVIYWAGGGGVCLRTVVHVCGSAGRAGGGG